MKTITPVYVSDAVNARPRHPFHSKSAAARKLIEYIDGNMLPKHAIDYDGKRAMIVEVQQ